MRAINKSCRSCLIVLSRGWREDEHEWLIDCASANIVGYSPFATTEKQLRGTAPEWTDSERRAHQLETAAILTAEQSEADAEEDGTTRLLAALTQIDEAISMAPHLPSPHNNRHPHARNAELLTHSPLPTSNRAQILRLLHRDGEAMSALKMAMRLCHNDPHERFAAVLRQASAQTGWLNFKAGRTEEAFAAFETAGRLGCVESRSMATRCNPYAALCNEMLQELLGSKFYSTPSQQQ